MESFLVSLFSILFIISIPIFLHELGHFLAARSVGIKVEKFYVGMNLFGLGIKKKIHETEYGIGLFPLGGYVKVAGIIDESLDSSSSKEIKDYEFRAKNAFQKLWFLSAGVMMNFILSVFIYMILFFSSGVEEIIEEPTISKVQQNIIIFNEINDTLSVKSPAAILGLKSEDVILKINDINIMTWTDIGASIFDKADSVVTITWKTEKDITKTESIQLAGRPVFSNGEITKQGILGIMGNTLHRDIGIIESFKIAVLQTYHIIINSFYGFVGIISGNLPLKYVSGIVGIAKEAGNVAQSSGFISLLSFMAFISANLGLINILPIPGLDGGHASIVIVEGIIRRELPVNIKYGIQFVGFVLIISLFIFTIFNDIKNIIN